jgi:hypothetical protein
MNKLIIVLCIFASIVQTSCSNIVRNNNSDDSLSSAIVGKWTVKTEEASFTLESITEYTADGLSHTNSVLTIEGEIINIEAKGKWKILNGILLTEVTDSSLPQLLKKGDADRDEIVSISREQAVFITSLGKKAIYQRVRTAPEGH